MRLDLFCEGDNILLLGEGNFSFARSLFAHNLPIKITATCFDNGEKYRNQLENIQFLKENNIPVFLDADATAVHEHPILKSQVFSKIIFNFPHVGGKMKIQLNRELVKKVCESASQLLKNDGLMIISLCNGQGGTPADNPQRKWDDSWKVTENAAYGSFCLVSVELFDFNNFQSYNCTGYRSQDTNFNLKGALVHIFRKKITPSRIIDDDEALRRLSLWPLSSNSDILVPFYYSELYLKNPLKNPNSAVNFFKKMIFETIENVNKLKLASDNCRKLVVKSTTGGLCKINNDGNVRLRCSALQITQELVEEYLNDCTGDETIFFPGMFFNFCLDEDFNKTPPISFQFLLVGESISVYFHQLITNLKALFSEDIKICKEAICPKMVSSFQDLNSLFKIKNCDSGIKWTFDSVSEKILAHELHIQNSAIEVFIIYVDIFIEIFFKTRSWKETWSEGSFVSFDQKSKPILNHCVAYPLSYKFDVTLRYDSDKEVLEKDVYEVLRISAIDLIKKVKLISQYNSGRGWSSKCFRITYESFNEFLHREKALDIHSNLIVKMLNLALPVTIN